MAWGIGVPSPKPKRKVSAATRKRRERKVIERVRALVEARDGFCRMRRLPCFVDVFGQCQGVSEWAHLGDLKRFKTRGQAPERRHTTGGTAMLCTKHHHDYDAHRIEIRAVTERGADGPLIVEKR